MDVNKLKQLLSEQSLNFIKENNLSDDEIIQNFQTFLAYDNNIENKTHCAKLIYQNGTISLNLANLNGGTQSNGIIVSSDAQIPYIAQKISETSTEARKQVLNFVKKQFASNWSKGIYIYGKIGVGKTTIFKCIAQVLDKSNKINRSFLLLSTNLLREDLEAAQRLEKLNKSYNYFTKLKIIKQVDILMLDNFNISYLIDYPKFTDTLMNIIEYRKENGLVTLYNSTTNILNKNIENNCSDNIKRIINIIKSQSIFYNLDDINYYNCEKINKE